jgi:hypothetical protein
MGSSTVGMPHVFLNFLEAPPNLYHKLEILAVNVKNVRRKLIFIILV